MIIYLPRRACAHHAQNASHHDSGIIAAAAFDMLAVLLRAHNRASAAAMWKCYTRAVCIGAEMVLARLSTNRAPYRDMPYASGAARIKRRRAWKHLCYHAIIVTLIVPLVNIQKSYILLYIIFAAALRARARIRAYACALALAYTYRKEKQKAASGIFV